MKNILLQILLNASKNSKFTGIYPEVFSVATTYSPFENDVIATITWSFPSVDIDGADIGLSQLKDVKQVVMSRPADTTIRVNDYCDIRDIERDMLTAAWTMGSYSMRRIEKAPSITALDRAIDSSFGLNLFCIGTSPLQKGDRADENSIDESKSNGMVIYQFIPLALAGAEKKERCIKKDRTLSIDCSRDGKPDIALHRFYRPKKSQTAHEHIYELGKSTVTKSSANKFRRRRFK